MLGAGESDRSDLVEFELGQYTPELQSAAPTETKKKTQASKAPIHIPNDPPSSDNGFAAEGRFLPHAATTKKGPNALRFLPPSRDAKIKGEEQMPSSQTTPYEQTVHTTVPGGIIHGPFSEVYMASESTAPREMPRPPTMISTSTKDTSTSSGKASEAHKAQRETSSFALPQQQLQAQPRSGTQRVKRPRTGDAANEDHGPQKKPASEAGLSKSRAGMRQTQSTQSPSSSFIDIVPCLPCIEQWAHNRTRFCARTRGFSLPCADCPDPEFCNEPFDDLEPIRIDCTVLNSIARKRFYARGFGTDIQDEEENWTERLRRVHVYVDKEYLCDALLENISRVRRISRDLKKLAPLASLESLLAKMDNLEGRIQTLQSQRATQQEEIASLRCELEEMRARNVDAEQDVDSMQHIEVDDGTQHANVLRATYPYTCSIAPRT